MSEPLRVTVDGAAPPTADLAAAAGHIVDWVAGHRAALDAALAEYGALYLAGAGITDRAEFAAIRDVLFDTPAGYKEKATPRSDFGAGVFSSTDLPPSQEIRQHNENSYTLTFPGKLLFGCLTAPATGGATTVADVREVMRTLPRPIADRMADVGWLLSRNYHDAFGLPWRTAFGTDDRADVEAYCAANAIGCEWTDGSLHTRQLRPGILRHPGTGQTVWFNHAAFWSEWTLDVEIREVLVAEVGDQLPFMTSYGDGTELTEPEVGEINAAYERATQRRPWQAGDLLLVDNVLSSHGRDAFTGSRDIVLAMGDPTALTHCAPVGPSAAAR